MRRDVRHRCHPVCWGVMLVLANVWFSGTPAAFGDGSKNAPEKKGFNTGQAMEEPQVSEGLLGADLESGSSFGGFETGNGEIEPDDGPELGVCRPRHGVTFWDVWGECLSERRTRIMGE